MLSCDTLSCVRGYTPIFSGLGFTIGPSTALVVTGSNGSGKTSLLRMIAGLLPPTSGRITWHGTSIRDRNIATEYKANLCYVGTLDAMKHEWTVLENLRFYAVLDDALDRLEAAISYFQLEHYSDTPFYMLSSGWQRRVALARLLLIESSLWILDEPATHLDQDGLSLLVHLINMRTNQGGMVILATHQALKLNYQIVLNMKDFKG